MQPYIYLAIAIISEVIATTALKSSEGFTRLVPSIIVIAGYCCAFYFLSLTLKTISVGVSYAIWAGIGIVLITLLGWVIYGQKIDFFAAFGMGLIIAGVVVINVFSKTAAH